MSATTTKIIAPLRKGNFCQSLRVMAEPRDLSASVGQPHVLPLCTQSSPSAMKATPPALFQIRCGSA